MDSDFDRKVEGREGKKKERAGVYKVLVPPPQGLKSKIFPGEAPRTPRCRPLRVAQRGLLNRHKG